MSDIHIITFNPQYTKLILAALKFYPNSSKANLIIHSICPEQPVELPCYLTLNSYNAPDDLLRTIECIKSKRMYGSIDDFSSICKLKGQQVSTLCLHPDIRLLHCSFEVDLPEFSVGYLECDRDLAPSGSHNIYPNITAFRKLRADEEILVTSNIDLMHALINSDTVNWIISHPQHRAVNLALELWDDPINHIQGMLDLLAGTQRLGIGTSITPNMIDELNTFRKDNVHSYSFFAKHYDEYMAHVAYDVWAQRVLGWFKLYCNQKLTKILELACGTANVSSRLVLQGYQVDACDLSPEMLYEADKKQLKPNLYRASLTDGIPSVDYELALCMFDSVNYLLKTSEISRMLERVYACLKGGGIFIFDISTVFNSEENFSDVCNLSKHQEGYLVHKAWYDPDKARQYSSLTCFKKEFIGYSYQYELHKQRVYLCHELVAIIDKSPLKLLAIHSSESKMNFYPRHVNGLDDRYSRLFFVLQREALG